MTNAHTIDLSGADAPDYVSAAAMNPPRTIVGAINAPLSSWPSNVAWDGKTGADGGSIYIYAKNKRGTGKLTITVSGGDGGRGQDGRRGNSGTAQTWLFPVEHGEDGGNGGKGGEGGDAGEIIINSMTNPSNIIQSTTSAGGSGGGGGRGGRGGRGATSSWPGWPFYLTNARRGDNGARGARGVSGTTIPADTNTLTNSGDFYRSIPITGNHLQRALNAEMHKIMLARYQTGSDKWNKIKNSVGWIKDIASANGYDIVHQRCTYLLRLCDQFQPQARLSSQTQISKSAIKKHIDELKSVAEQAVTITPSDINDRIQDSQLLKDHSHYARAFNHIATQFNKSKGRYDNEKVDAALLGTTLTIESTITSFLSSKFSSKLSSKITSLARGKSYVATALDTVGTGGTVAVDTAEILGELAVSAEAAPILGLVVAEQLVQPSIEEVAVKVIGGSVMSELNKVWGNLFDDIEEALSNSERINQARAMDQKRTGSNRNSRIKKDEKLQKTLLPSSRKEYLRRGRRDRPLVGQEDSEPPKPQPYELTGKYIGVLDKLEPIETENSNQVVVTFDAILVEFTVPKGQTTISINNLDSEQQMELFSTLGVYRDPFSELSSFFITTTVNSGSINENQVGKWFEFDCEFGEGTGDAVVITPIIALNDIFMPKYMASLDTDDDISVTVTSIKQLNTGLEAKIILELGLDNSLTTVKKRQVAENTPTYCGHTQPYCGDAQYPYVVSRVEVANVGQGSCNLLYTLGHNNRPAAVYDLGYGKGKLTGEAEENLINKIVQAHSIVISHWDLDHYRYLLRNPQRILAVSKYVTAPVFGSNAGVSVKRAVRSIRDYHRRLIDANTGFVPFSGAVVCNIDMRTTTTATGRNKNNVGALTVSLLDYNCNSLMLMPGDASYAHVPNQHKFGQYNPLQNSPSLKYLVATHHGSTRNIQPIPQPLQNNFFSAVMYSYGQNNRYGHSQTTAQPLYQQQGWNAAPQNTVGTANGLYVILDLDRTNLNPPHRF